MLGSIRFFQSIPEILQYGIKLIHENQDTVGQTIIYYFLVDFSFLAIYNNVSPRLVVHVLLDEVNLLAKRDNILFIIESSF